MYILLRSCGGLGNQLFQSFFASLMAEKYNQAPVYHFHSTNYDRYASWENTLHSFNKCNYFFLLLLRLRLPKILFRLSLIKTEYIKIGPILLLDGYFLDFNQYKIFNQEHLTTVLNNIKKNLYPPDNILKDKKLIHLRLGDFFKSEDEEYQYTHSVLSMIKDNVDLVTSNDKLIQDVLSVRFNTNINYIKTTNFSAIDLIRLASQYNEIQYNGSTLIFWASLISDSRLTFDTSTVPNQYVKKNCEYLDSLKAFISSKTSLHKL